MKHVPLTNLMTKFQHVSLRQGTDCVLKWQERHQLHCEVAREIVNCFASCFREEYGRLFDFVNGKHLRIKNTGKVRNKRIKIFQFLERFQSHLLNPPLP